MKHAKPNKLSVNKNRILSQTEEWNCLMIRTEEMVHGPGPDETRCIQGRGDLLLCKRHSKEDESSMSKTAVITGGTRGIGLETVRLFAENGYHVVFYGSRKETVDKALAQLDGLEVEGKWTDLTDEEAIRRDFRQIAETRGSLDVLINNAGISDRQPFLDYDLERFDRIMRLNVTAPYVCSQAAAVIMKDQGHGVILNTSSMVGTYGQPAGVAYPVSKWAVNGMTKSLARELGPFNIRVNAVAPGVTATDMVRALPEEMVERISQGIPLRRVGKPSDIAHAFLFLASDEAGYITGAILPVDGATQV